MKEAIELLLDWRNGLALLLAIGIALLLRLDDAPALFVLFILMVIATRLALFLIGRARARPAATPSRRKRKPPPRRP